LRFGPVNPSGQLRAEQQRRKALAEFLGASFGKTISQTGQTQNSAGDDEIVLKLKSSVLR